jgi:putative tryptophan/tyrosine transport system substrate-binding protein
MRRREFIAGLGGAAAWPLAAQAAQAQQGERLRRIGVLMPYDENDPFAKLQLSTLTQALADLGWADGRNVRMDFRWAGGDIDRIGAFAQELVALQPDIIVASSTPVAAALQRETRTIPIVFANVSDPVVSGIVAAFNQSGGNITGFALYESPLGGKWLELLSEIAPGLKRAAIMFNPDTAPVSAFMPSLETAARSLKVVPIPGPVHRDVEIETALIALGREPRGGLVVMPDTFTAVHRVAIISAAARNNVPAVYPRSDYARDGGLLSYGVDQVDPWRRAAPYVDRILRGAKPSEFPVQFSTKFELVINLKAAKALGLTIPPNLLAIADEVIE